MSSPRAAMYGPGASSWRRCPTLPRGPPWTYSGRWWGCSGPPPSKTQVHDNTIAVGERASSDAGRECIPKLLRHLCRLRPGLTPQTGLTHQQSAAQSSVAHALVEPAIPDKDAGHAAVEGAKGGLG